MNKFKVGDRVRVIEPCSGTIDDKEYIVCAKNGGLWIDITNASGGCYHQDNWQLVKPENSVCFYPDSPYLRGMNLNSLHVNEFSNYKWGADFSYTKIKQPKKTLMSQLTTIAKKLLDGDTKKMIEAGFLDQNLNLTNEGKNALHVISFDKHKKELVEAAKEVIAERKEECEKDC